MNLTNVAIRQLQDAPFPDFITRPAIDSLVTEARKRLDRDGPHDEAAFARDMAQRAIAEHTDAANQQHYELPPEFFQLCLGERLKYSCCLYPTGAETLDQAEKAALAETCVHADLSDGQTILEMGCGWGSLSLWMAETYPNAKITAVSNSHGQRGHIEAQAAARGLTNLTVITRDMNAFETDQRFDRIVSVEMFEHMANWRALLTKARGWLKDDGRMFIHVFTHRDAPYRFDHTDSGDFIAQHFFTGGVMPSHGLIRQFPDLFRGGAGMDLERRLLRPDRQRLAGQYGSERPADRGVDAPDLWRRRQAVDPGAGGGSTWRRPACSATTKGGPGRSAITD